MFKRREMATTNKTWANLKIHFKTVDHDHRLNLTTKYSRFSNAPNVVKSPFDAAHHFNTMLEQHSSQCAATTMVANTAASLNQYLQNT